MKKFGTPIGAGPGSENENDGFDAVETPPLLCCGCGDFGLEFFLAGGFGVGLGLGLALGLGFDLGFEPPLVPGDEGCLEGRWVFRGRSA